MIVLTLIFCLSAEPKACETVTPALPGLTQQQCMIAAQTTAIEWLSEHGDGWTLAEMRCGPPEKGA